MTSDSRARVDAIERARAAARHALPVMDRVRGIVAQLTGDSPASNDIFVDSEVTEQGAQDLAELLPPLLEHLRYIRVQYGSVILGDQTGQLSVGPTGQGLPLNRKEQYYTATVLPMIIASDGFAHIHRFFRLCGLELSPSGSREANPGFQFFSEYNLAESLRPSDLERFPNAPTSHDTPDLMFVGPDWMLAVEAKVFHDPSPEALDAQLGRQRKIIDYLADALGIAADRVHHVLLLPSGLEATGVSAPVVTWEAVVEGYRVVGPKYWVLLLHDALERYDQLKSVSAPRGQNNDAYLTGAQIVAGAKAGTLGFTFMGRNRGLDGPELAKDIATGAWRTQRYEVREEPLEARNWFAIAAFLQKLPGAG